MTLHRGPLTLEEKKELLILASEVAEALLGEPLRHNKTAEPLAEGLRSLAKSAADEPEASLARFERLFVAVEKHATLLTGIPP